MLFSITASVLDTLLIKTSAFVISQSFNLLHLGGSTLYYSYVGKPLTKEEQLQIEINGLKEDIEILKQLNVIQQKHNEDNDYGVIAL